MAVARLAAAVAIKQEPPDSPTATTSQSLGATESHTHLVEPRPVHPVELDERILNLCSQNPKGITDDIIMMDQPQINTEQRMKALQRLLSQACACVCVRVSVCLSVCGVHVSVPVFLIYALYVHTHTHMYTHTHVYGSTILNGSHIVPSLIMCVYTHTHIHTHTHIIYIQY